MVHDPKYPFITVKLVGQSGNAFAILGKVSQAMKKFGLPNDVISEFSKEALEGDYDHLLRTCMEWVNVE